MVDTSLLDPDSISVEDGEVVQLDGGYATPTNDVGFSSLFFSQVDGAGDEPETELIKREPQQEQEPAQNPGAESEQAVMVIQKSETVGPSEDVPDEFESMETSDASETESPEAEGIR